jgi:hypothetical protein
VDELTELRRMRAEVPRPSPDRLTTGRERLLAAIDAEPAAPIAHDTTHNRPFLLGEFMKHTENENGTRHPVRRRQLLGIVVAAATAVAVTATVVVADNLGDQKGSSASVSGSGDGGAELAKKVLRDAADKARSGPEAKQPRDDQFVYTKGVARETDRKTGKSKTYTDESWTSADLSKRSWEEDLGEGHWSDPVNKRELDGTWPHYDWSLLEKLPTDPAKLILKVRKPMGPPVKATSLKQVRKPEWQGIHADLTSYATAVPVIPKDLRAAALDALTMVPGIQAKRGMKDIDGRPAVAITSKNALFKESVLLFDEDSGEFLGSTGVRTPDKKTLDQLSQLKKYAIVDKAKQQP